MGAAEVGKFLTRLSVAWRVSASTQNQAKSALLFLYKEALEQPPPWLDKTEFAQRPKRLPVVLTTDEIKVLLTRVHGTVGLMLRLIYGTGMRITECVRLRMKDVDFARGEITIREGKSIKERVTMPSSPSSCRWGNVWQRSSVARIRSQGRPRQSLFSACPGAKVFPCGA
jgi:integrase